MTIDNSKLPRKSTASEVDAFLKKVADTPAASNRASGRGRLLFALDATASREPTWDQACNIQGEMFLASSKLGGLDVKLCFYRGFRQLLTTSWCNDSSELLQHMTKVRCAGGMTQIGRLLRYAVKETTRRSVNAMVFVGDCMEEDLDQVCEPAGQLGLLGVPVFVFHEGYDQVAERAFRDIARLSKGAYCRFDAGSAEQLRELLGAVAAYAAGGHAALEQFGKHRGPLVTALRKQLGKQG